MQTFDYDKAFSRNIGWVTVAEQARLRHAKVAIGGLGGVGGVHLLSLARLGIGRFAIADFDVFDIANFNRQVGATVDSLEQAKIEVLAGMARAINPEIILDRFPSGIRSARVSIFDQCTGDAVVRAISNCRNPLIPPPLLAGLSTLVSALGLSSASSSSSNSASRPPFVAFCASTRAVSRSEIKSTRDIELAHYPSSSANQESVVERMQVVSCLF